ncbi:hypothetical protein NEOLEDRAFT_1077142 [Neolentinus lepideus HHB14362 ss-1]|uniref:DUF3669 domain-containing protein n=1 Tax=Neolentinus lepideus HHB14362 ss-1 TaxID=1314782 RepID=A0A165NLY7_9AGAM|nr:hypothetical protein NEOLEDRAFT_1077142 [Neolentinus lepideus HHB14362 ss-1]
MADNIHLQPADPVRIGSGSFGNIYLIGDGSAVAYKEVQRPSDAAVLHDEFATLEKIYSCCDMDSFFVIPRALAFSDPSTSRFHEAPPGPTRRRPLRPAAAYLPPPTPVGPALCRLYFGKRYAARFASAANFPVDAQRYERLRASFAWLPSQEEVAAGMGEMVGRLHWAAGVDARGVEFVMGGDGGSGAAFFVIDYDQVPPAQVRRWADVGDLVRAFFANDPYFPRPRQGDPLYLAFKRAYLEQYGQSTMHVGEAFIEAIQAEQATRDSRAASSTPDIES